MRTPIISALSLALIMPLAGCTAAPEKKTSLYDTDFMSRVERRAQTSGLEVIWINPPYSRVEDEEVDDG